ncbi:MAG: hypothetical protein IJJ10_06670 [Bacillus sp. (in: Bacteria)]|nr:hypothetical protein [Bacillus sp. (in: firmicutes)]
MKNVKRVTLTGNWTEVTFDEKAKNYFVKNFSDGDIYVSFEENDSENTSFKISSGIGEVLAINQTATSKPEHFTNTIYIKGTGEVEIEQM